MTGLAGLPHVKKISFKTEVNKNGTLLKYLYSFFCFCLLYLVVKYSEWSEMYLSRQDSTTPVVFWEIEVLYFDTQEVYYTLCILK